MASAAPLKDIDEQFLQCAICLNQLRDPTILPCLHRYCRGCIKEIAPKRGKKIKCPTCRENHALPEGGANALKTDFNTNNIIEFIQLHDSVKYEPLKVCANCSKKQKVASFCFRCNDFLCRSCDEHHKTSKIVRDHVPHIFSLSEVEARNLTIAKLSTLKEGPRCHHHQERAAELCCTACGNLPICVACTHGDHQGHSLKEVGSLARIEREKLTKKVANLMQYKHKVHQIPENITKAAEELQRKVAEERSKLQKQVDAGEQKVKDEAVGRERKLAHRRTDLGEKVERKLLARKQELDEEIRRATEKYERGCKEDRRKVDADFKELQQEIEREKAKTQESVDNANKEIKELLQSVDTLEEKKTKKIEELSSHVGDIVKRFEIATATASSILDAKCDWTDVQCIPDVCSAIDPLIGAVRAELQALEMITEIRVGEVPSVAAEVRVVVTERAESVVDIKGNRQGWCIQGITGNKDGSCVITGGVGYAAEKTYVTVINSKGHTLGQVIYDSFTDRQSRHCDFISRFLVASVCSPDEIGLFDIRDGDYRRTKISHITSSWPAGRDVSCVAADPSINHIFVGGEVSRDVAVFSGDLKHIHTMTLPGEIEWPIDMTIHSSSSSLLVCDGGNNRVYALTMGKGSVCRIEYEFMKPGDGEPLLWPRGVCTDRNGFVYIVWTNRNSSMCAQYSKVGGKLLTTRSLNGSTSCITTAGTEQEEKLVIPTHGDKLTIYGLIVGH